jgi:hypothetical protein
VNPDGKIGNLDVLPKVKNSEMFIEDMEFAIKKIKKEMEARDERRSTGNF